MSTAALHLLREFEKLPPDDQREFSVLVTRRAARLEHAQRAEADDFTVLATQSLSRAYGDAEPEYTPADLKTRL